MKFKIKVSLLYRNYHLYFSLSTPLFIIRETILVSDRRKQSVLLSVQTCFRYQEADLESQLQDLSVLKTF